MAIFYALDVETANSDIASICQIGVVAFNGESYETVWDTYVNPGCKFDEFNIKLHGIDEGKVRHAITSKEALQYLIDNFSGEYIVHHTSFDLNALQKAADRYGVSLCKIHWVDSSEAVRKAWPEVSQKGYGLKDLSKKFNIKFTHHNAAEDARVAGFLFIKAAKEMNLPVTDLLKNHYVFPKAKTDRMIADKKDEEITFSAQQKLIVALIALISIFVCIFVCFIIIGL